MEVAIDADVQPTVLTLAIAMQGSSRQYALKSCAKSRDDEVADHGGNQDDDKRPIHDFTPPLGI
jgi:hypothetical protein